MSMSLLQFIIAAILITGGVVIAFMQTVGIFRFGYVLNRMHAAAMGDSLGIFLVLLGLVVIYGISYATLKLISILLVFWFASPTCSHLLSKLEVNTNKDIDKECEVDHDRS